MRNAAWLDAQDDVAYERAAINVARAAFGIPVTLITPITSSHTPLTVSDVTVSREGEDGGGAVTDYAQDFESGIALLREFGYPTEASDFDEPFADEDEGIIGYGEDEPVWGECVCGKTHSFPL